MSDPKYKCSKLFVSKMYVTGTTYNFVLAYSLWGAILPPLLHNSGNLKIGSGYSSELLWLLFYFSFECFWKKLGQSVDPVKNYGNFVGPCRKYPPKMPKNVENRDKPGKTAKSEVSLGGNYDMISHGTNLGFLKTLDHPCYICSDLSTTEHFTRFWIGGRCNIPP